MSACNALPASDLAYGCSIAKRIFAFRRILRIDEIIFITEIRSVWNCGAHNVAKCIDDSQEKW